MTVADGAPDCPLYVLPGLAACGGPRSDRALVNPVVVLNKADSISPDPVRIERVAAEISAELGMPVVPMTAHIADVETDDEQFDALRSLAVATDAGARVASIVFSDSPLRSWGPPAVAVAVSALRQDPALDRAGISRILSAFSGVGPVA